MRRVINHYPEPFCTVICGPCGICGNETRFYLPTEKVISWRGGNKIQDEFPDMTPMERETLISGICSQKCWDRLWAED